MQTLSPYRRLRFRAGAAFFLVAVFFFWGFFGAAFFFADFFFFAGAFLRAGLGTKAAATSAISFSILSRRAAPRSST